MSIYLVSAWWDFERRELFMAFNEIAQMHCCLGRAMFYCTVVFLAHSRQSAAALALCRGLIRTGRPKPGSRYEKVSEAK